MVKRVVEGIEDSINFLKEIAKSMQEMIKFINIWLYFNINLFLVPIMSQNTTICLILCQMQIKGYTFLKNLRTKRCMLFNFQIFMNKFTQCKKDIHLGNKVEMTCLENNVKRQNIQLQKLDLHSQKDLYMLIHLLLNLHSHLICTMIGLKYRLILQ